MATKSTKKRPSKKNGGRQSNKIFLGLGILAALLIITLIIAINGVKQQQEANLTQPSQSQNLTKISTKKEPLKSIKDEKWYKKPPKFNDDENLSQIFSGIQDESGSQRVQNLEASRLAAEKRAKEQDNIKKQNQASTPLVEKIDKNDAVNLEKDTGGEFEREAASKILEANKTSEQAAFASEENLNIHTPFETQNFESNDLRQEDKNLTNEKVLVEAKDRAEPKKTEKQRPKKSEKKQAKIEKSEVFDHNPPATFKGKPRLVIIIDDVATHEHARLIRSTGLPLTPSIFPANKFHPDTPSIARGFEFFMIHFPMEAKNFGRPEPDTLNVGDSFESILKRVRRVRKDFPNAVYVNNHTGSKFTSDMVSMERAYKAFMQENFIFMDSRTIGNSVVPKLAKKYNRRYITRDIFLDNDQSHSAIQRQLKEAIKIAKRRGYAIAIGHPHKSTIEVLRAAKKSILEDVEVVYLKDVL